MGKYSVVTPGLIGALRDRWRYRHHFDDIHMNPVQGEQEASWVEALRTQGFVQIPDFIDPITLNVVQSELQRSYENLEFETPCFAQSRVDSVRHADLLESKMYASTDELVRRGLTFDRSECRLYSQVVNEFKPSTLTLYMLRRSAVCRQLWLDERLLRCVAAYLQMVPYLVEAYVRRNFPAPHRTMNHFWHRDLNGHFLLKAFFFFTDCSIDNGPHEFIRGSHRRLDVLNGKRYFEDEDVDRLFPADSSERIVSEVKAGTLIIEDTRGLHRARMPRVEFRDLGYAVFLPMSKNCTRRYYDVDSESVKSLTPFQRRFLPPQTIIQR